MLEQKIEPIKLHPTSFNMIQQTAQTESTCFFQQCWTMLEQKIKPIRLYTKSFNMIEETAQTESTCLFQQ